MLSRAADCRPSMEFGMSETGLFIIHQTKPGKREAVKAIWLKHMAPAIQANPGHKAYFYTFDKDDPDVICAFQLYASAEAAREFLSHPAYLAYLAESREFLEHAPEVRTLAPQWVKAV